MISSYARNLDGCFGNGLMPFLNYRSFNSLNSFTYPKEGLLGHWTLKSFTNSSVQLVDASENQNNAALKTGREVVLDGVSDYVQFDAFATPVKTLRVLLKKPTNLVIPELFSASDGLGQVAAVAVFGPSVYNLFDLEFDTATTSTINVGTDGTGHTSGLIGYVEFLGADGNVIDKWIAADYEDPLGVGLDSLPLVTQNGNTGSFVGCQVNNGVGVEADLSNVDQLQPPQLAGLNWNYLTNDDRLIPQSLDGNTTAFGGGFNYPRPTQTSFNVPAGGNISINNIPAYDDIKTIMLWHYHKADDTSIVDFNNASVFLNYALGDLTLLGVTDETIYINGAVSSTPGSGWNFITVTTPTGFSANNITINEDNLLDQFLLYSDAKTPEEIADLYNATKGDYSANPYPANALAFDEDVFAYDDNILVF